jgi:hypothetical protein
LSRRPADVAAAFDAAERSGTVLAEAFMYRYHPATTLARQLVDDGAIGELAYVKGTLSFTMEGADVRLSKAVDEDPRLNTIATPTFAPDAAELICIALERQVTGTLHCCGGEHIDRVALARRAAEAFGFDPERVSVGAPDPAMLGSGAAPYDTSLDATRTAQRLGVELTGIDELLGRLRAQLEAAWAST